MYGCEVSTRLVTQTLTRTHDESGLFIDAQDLKPSASILSFAEPFLFFKRFRAINLSDDYIQSKSVNKELFNI